MTDTPGSDPNNQQHNPIYWCPEHEGIEAFILGVVKNPPSVIRTTQDYRMLLMERIREYLEAEPNPDEMVRALQRKMDEIGIEPMWSGPTEDAPNVLIYSNPAIEDYLRLQGLNLSFPMETGDGGPEAQEAYEETTLDDWITFL